jgi:hypothetical protein
MLGISGSIQANLARIRLPSQVFRVNHRKILEVTAPHTCKQQRYVVFIHQGYFYGSEIFIGKLDKPTLNLSRAEDMDLKTPIFRM